MTGVRGLKPLARKAAYFVVHFTHGGLVVAGVLAIVIFAVRFDAVQASAPKPAATSLLPSRPVLPAQADMQDAAFEETVAQTPALVPELRPVVEYLSKKYRVAAEALEPLVSAAHAAGRRAGVDPLLVISVMAIESRFNPFAESPMGAVGLMQIIPRYHKDKLGEADDDTLLDPVVNINVGTQVLKESIRRAGSVEGGLDQYGGVVENADVQYSARVLAEKRRLEAAARRGRATLAQAS